MYDLCPYFTNDGTVGLFSSADDDIYHSAYGALSESYQKFVIPSHFDEYLKTHESLNVLDICYGIGYNTKAALNEFIKKYFENEKKCSKKSNCLIDNIEAIGTDNILARENSKISKISEIGKKISNSINYDNSQVSCIEKIDTDNINDTKNSNSVRIKEEKILKKNFSNATENFCTNLKIDAVDIDGVLINLSPFITRGMDSNFKLKKYLKNANLDFAKDRPKQVEKIKNAKISKLPKNYKLRREVQMIIFEKILEQKLCLNYQESLAEIFTQKHYSSIFDNCMLNFANFLSDNMYKYNKKPNKLAFLHNIYYRYISRSYKMVQKLLKNQAIDLIFHPTDVRMFIKEAKSKYNLIFLDAFTPTKCPALWTVQFFSELYNHLDSDGMILTYSCSATIRQAFAKSGFKVGKIYDKVLDKFIGTVAVKDENLIEYKLDEKDVALMNSKAGICYNDNAELTMSNDEILKNRQYEFDNSNLPSSTKVVKGLKNNEK